MLDNSEFRNPQLPTDPQRPLPILFRGCGFLAAEVGNWESLGFGSWELSAQLSDDVAEFGQNQFGDAEADGVL